MGSKSLYTLSRVEPGYNYTNSAPPPPLPTHTQPLQIHSIKQNRVRVDIRVRLKKIEFDYPETGKHPN